MMVNGIEVIRDTRAALAALDNEPSIAIDLETGGLSPQTSPIAVVSMYGENTDALAVLHVRGNLPPELKDFIGRKDKTFTYHNGVAFDLPFLMQHGVMATRPKIYDTLVGAGVVVTTNRHGQRKSLQAEVDRRLGVYISKETDHSAWMDPELSTKQVSYCAEDLLHLHALRNEQIAKSKEQGQYGAYMMEMELVPVTATMTHNGLPFSRTALEDYQSQVRMFVAVEGTKFRRRFGDINTKSAKQIGEVLRSMGMILPKKRNPKGEIKDSTAAAVMESLLRKDDETDEFSPAASAQAILNKGLLADTDQYPDNVNFVRARMIAEVIHVMFALRKGEKNIGMYDEGWIREYAPQGRIHARFWQMGTDTGRYSSTDPNFQQWPRLMRGVIGHQEGHSIVSVDYSQLEVVVSAWLSQDSTLLQMIESGQDIHTLIASQIFNKPVSSIAKDSRERQVAKACSFCLLFGGGAATLMEYALKFGAVLTLPESREIVTSFFARFRGAAKDRVAAYEMAKRATGVVELQLVNGLKRHLVGNSIIGTKILNTRVQGNAAVGMKYALLDAHKAGLTMYIGATVHDELVACVPDEWAEEFSHELEKCMIRGMNRVVGCTVRAHGTVKKMWSK